MLFGGRKAVEPRADLVADLALTCALLARPLEWRVRASEVLEIGSALTCVRYRTLQVAPLAPILADVVEGPVADHVWVALPIANVPKDLTQGSSITVAGRPGYVLPRLETARRQAAYAATVARDAAAPPRAEVEALLARIFGYTSGPWSAYLQTFDAHAGQALRGFLSDAARAPLHANLVSRWCAASDLIHGVLLNYLDDAPDERSVGRHPVLALAGLLGDGYSPRRATVAIEALCTLLENALAAARATPVSAATDLLNVVANYTTRYDLIAVCEVPSNEPFLVETVERRSLNLEHRMWERAHAVQDFVIADANSNHVGITVTDAHVEIRKVTAHRPRGEDVALLVPGAADRLHEAFTFYASNPDRDYLVRLNVRLGPALLSHFVMGTILGVSLLAAGMMLAMKPIDATTVGVLVVPTTFAASALLVRERSSLGSRLRRWWTVSVAVTLIALWATVAWRYRLNEVSISVEGRTGGTVSVSQGR